MLFDLQEVDTHIHSLATATALPLLSFTAQSVATSSAVLNAVDGQLTTLKRAYDHLHSEVVQRSRCAEEVLVVVERLHDVTAQLREIGRALVLARQLEVLIAELTTPGGPAGDHKALVRAGQHIRELHDGKVLADVDDGVVLVHQLRTLVFGPAEAFVLSKAREAVLGFEPNAVTNPASTGSAAAAAATATPPANGSGDGFGAGLAGRNVEAMKAKATAGALALFLLSQHDRGALLTAAVQSLLDAAINGSLVALARSLTAVTTLDRSVGEVAARCQNVVALQTLLAGIPLPSGGLESGGGGGGVDMDAGGETAAAASGGGGRRSLLQPLLEQLDTTSLQTLFFRSVAAGLEPRVGQVVARGGANARILRGAKDRVRSAFRACVERGLAVGVGGEQQAVDFEVSVMVGATAALGR